MPVTIPGTPTEVVATQQVLVSLALEKGLNLDCLQTLGKAAVVVGDPQVVAKCLGSSGAQALHVAAFLHGSSPTQTGGAHWPAPWICHVRLLNHGQQGWLVAG